MVRKEEEFCTGCVSISGSTSGLPRQGAARKQLREQPAAFSEPVWQWDHATCRVSVECPWEKGIVMHPQLTRFSGSSPRLLLSVIYLLLTLFLAGCGFLDSSSSTPTSTPTTSTTGNTTPTTVDT